MRVSPMFVARVIRGVHGRDARATSTLVEIPQVIVSAFSPGVLGALLFFFGGQLMAHEEVGIDVLLYCEHGVEEALHSLAAVTELIFHHSLRMRRNTLDHAPVGFRKVDVVLKKV